MSLLISLVYNLRLYQLAQPIYGGSGHIITLHRVVKNLDLNRISWSSNLEVTTRYLEETIKFFIQNKYDIISLDELHLRLIEKKIKNKFVVFTFDDGYEDNFELAYPLFKKYNIPFAIYITKALIENNLKCWWYDIEDMVLCYNQLIIGNRQLETISKSQKEEAYLLIRAKIIHVPFEEGYAFYNELMSRYPPCKQNTSWKPMSKEQLFILNNDPLVTLGAHTANHYPLSRMQLAEATYEVVESKQYLESLLQKPIEHFAYPYGSADEVGDREVEIAKGAGFITSTTTRIANIFKAHNKYTYALPRIPLIESPREKMLFKMSLSGFLPAYLHHGKRLVMI